MPQRKYKAMAKALDKILSGKTPLHQKNTDAWGVPAYWLETQFSPEDSIEVILKKFFEMISLGLPEKEEKDLRKWMSEHSNLDTKAILWNLFSYMDMAVWVHWEFVNEKGIVDSIKAKGKQDSGYRKKLV